MWDPPGPGLESVSPALAGRLPTTAPPGKPTHLFFKVTLIQCDKGCKQEATLRVGLGKLAQIPDRGVEKQKPGVQGGWGSP